MTISVLDKDGNPQTLDPPTQTTLAAILAKLSSDPATQTTLAAILAKLIAAPATEAKQDAIVTALGTPLPITAQGTPTDRSSTLTTGGTAQQLAAANTSRKYLLVQNQSSGYLYIRFTGTATQDQTSLRIESGGSYENPPHYCPTSAVSIIGATTGQAWHSVEA